MRTSSSILLRDGLRAFANLNTILAILEVQRLVTLARVTLRSGKLVRPRLLKSGRPTDSPLVPPRLRILLRDVETYFYRWLVAIDSALWLPDSSNLIR